MLKRIILFCLLLSNPIGTTAQGAAGDLLGRINALRTGQGLPGYTLNAALNAAANNQAQWMVDTGNVSHIESDGSSPRNRAQAAGYPSSRVSENIYMGGLATVDSAWSFWTNSPIHYAGLTSPSFSEIGIGTATGQHGIAYVLVFGNPSVPTSGDSSGNAGSSPSTAEPSAPSYFVGVDERGNLMHEVQPGDTIGDIALIYGYTWEDIPLMLELNDMTDENIRVLEVGSIFLVPPYDGTYTPTPDPATATSTSTSTLSPTFTFTPTATVPTPTPTPTGLVAPATYVVPTSEPTKVLIVKTIPVASPTFVPIPSIEPDPETNEGTNPLLWIAVGVQITVLVLASIEFIRRWRQ